MIETTSSFNDVPGDIEGLRTYVRGFRDDFDAHTHDGSNSRRFQTILAETLASRAISMRKTSYTSTSAGLWAGLVGSTVKFNLGGATSYLKWDGTNLEVAANITAGSITIGTNAAIDSSGNATFIGVTSLNMKAYTNFETVGRFVVTGDIAPVFGNQGMTVAPGATANHYARALWWISNYVFNNNPSFTCSLLALDNFDVGDGRGFIGLGAPTITGSALTMASINAIGFRIQKVSGVTTIVASNNDSNAGGATETNMLTITDGDSLELFLKVTATNVKYYYRKNGGTLTLGATHTTRIPTASETYISFMITNSNTTDDFKLQMQCAAYEH